MTTESPKAAYRMQAELAAAPWWRHRVSFFSLERLHPNPGDLLLTPGGRWHVNPTAEDTFVFSYGNRPVLQALGMWRDEYPGSEV